MVEGSVVAAVLVKSNTVGASTAFTSNSEPLKAINLFASPKTNLPAF